MALTKNPQLKVFIVSKLKDITKQIVNVATVIFSLRKENEELHQLYDSLNIHDELKKFYCNSQSPLNKSVSKRKAKKLKPENSTPIVYLKEEFLPSNNVEKMEVEDSNFISLKKYEESSYRPMKIKQVFANPNRKKK